MRVSQSPMSITFNWTQPVGEIVDNYEIFSYQGPCSGYIHANTAIVAGATRQHTLTGLQEFSRNGGGRSATTSQNVTTMAAGRLHLIWHVNVIGWHVQSPFLPVSQPPLLHLRQSLLQPRDQKVFPLTGIMLTALNVTVKSQGTHCTTILLTVLKQILHSQQTSLPTLSLDWLPPPTTRLRWQQSTAMVKLDHLLFPSMWKLYPWQVSAMRWSRSTIIVNLMVLSLQVH